MYIFKLWPVTLTFTDIVDDVVHKLTVTVQNIKNTNYSMKNIIDSINVIINKIIGSKIEKYALYSIYKEFSCEIKISELLK